MSHLHGDHWDRVARRGLRRSVPVVTTPHASRRLQGLHGFRRAVGLRTWERHDLVRTTEGGNGALLRVTALPGRHAPGVWQRLLPPVMGSLLEFLPPGADRGFRLYITGDTLLFDGISEIAARFGEVDAAVLHLGGTTLPGGLMVTMDGEQGARVVDIVRPRRAVPVHHADYSVFASPLADFLAAAQHRGLSDRVTTVEPGETVVLASGSGGR